MIDLETLDMPDLLSALPSADGYGNESLEAFRVTDAHDIALLLRELLDEGAIVHFSAPDGSGFSTTVWAVDARQQQVGFSVDVADPQLQALVDAGEATAVAYLDNVKLQFELRAPVLVHAGRTCVLQAKLPKELFRFQRRGSYRVRLLPRSTPNVTLRHPSLPDMQLALRVLDVSNGGCAIFLPDDVPPLPPGVRVQGARVELDADTRFDATLALQHVTSINPQSGGVRLGCSLTDLDSEAQCALQRYIDHTQKRRRLLSLD